jgi:hypothetical protein
LLTRRWRKQDSNQSVPPKAPGVVVGSVLIRAVFAWQESAEAT